MNATRWHISFAKVQGTGHERLGIPCQDKVYGIRDKQVNVVSLADGAGSAKLSHYGAEKITQTVSKYVIEHFDSLVLMSYDKARDKLLILIKETLELLSNDLKCSVKDLASTLLLVAVKKHRYFALHIGDGVIGYLFRDKLEVLSSPQNGEFDNLTWFTTSKHVRDALRVYRGNCDAVSGFILMSDGVEKSLYDCSNNILSNACYDLMYKNMINDTTTFNEMLRDTLSSVFKCRTNDDCAMAIMSRSRFKHYNEYSYSLKKLKIRSK